MSEPSIRILLADDHRVLREGVRERLDLEPDLTVVGEAADGAEALRAVEALDPDVLVLDMELPEVRGVDVARTLRDRGARVRILVLSAYDDDEYVRALLDAGAAGYLTKEESLETIVEAVRGVARGEDGWLSRRVAAKVLSLRRAPEPEPPAGGLTDRETEVLRLVARGQTNAAVAEALFISEHTVRNHLANVYQKLEVSNRAGAAAWAWQHGLVEG